MQRKRSRDHDVQATLRTADVKHVLLNMPKYANIALDLRLCSENARLFTACNRNGEKLLFLNMLKNVKIALALRLCSENARVITMCNPRCEQFT